MRLIPFTTDHFSTLASWFSSDADVVQWGGPLMHYPLDKPQMQSLLDECLTEPSRRKCWMADVDGQLVGHIELGFDWRNDNAVLQRVAIDPVLRGHGLAEPMVRMAIEQAFAIPRIARLELNVYSFNIPAIKTYSRLGFVHEGTRRSSTKVGDERWDSFVMSILRNDYSKSQNVEVSNE
jgi:RimJ/RimL family protein N-acetyltransferase